MNKKVRPLSKELAIEYVLAVATGLLILVVIPLAAESYLDGRPSGLDNIGEALAIVLAARAAYTLLTLAFLIVNPLRVFITQRKYINSRYEGFTKALKYIMILLPIIPALFVVFRIPISNALYDLKYNYSPDGRTVSEYKTAKDFEKELEKRGLLNNDNTARLVQQLNKKYEPGSLNSPQYYYEEPKLTAISDNTVYTESTNAKVITFDSTTTAPIYNTLNTRMATTILFMRITILICGYSMPMAIFMRWLAQTVVMLRRRIIMSDLAKAIRLVRFWQKETLSQHSLMENIIQMAR